MAECYQPAGRRCGPLCGGPKAPRDQWAQGRATIQGLLRVKDYCTNLYTTSSLDLIRAKVPLDSGVPPTFDMLANQEHVTAEERPAIRDWAKRAMPD